MFKFLWKVAKHKIASISLALGDREILPKFLTPRVSKQYATLTFGRFFKNGGHFKFSNFCEKWQNTKLLLSISLTVRDRAISSKFSTPPRCLSNVLYTLLEIFQKMAAIFNFRSPGCLSNMTPPLLCHGNLSISGDTSCCAADF